MLIQHLDRAGFFAIQWVPAEPGTTYVRPGARGVVRVFVPADRDEMELYVGSLAAGELRYRGPVPAAAELRQWLGSDCSYPGSRLRPATALASAA